MVPTSRALCGPMSRTQTPAAPTRAAACVRERATGTAHTCGPRVPFVSSVTAPGDARVLATVGAASDHDWPRRSHPGRDRAPPPARHTGRGEVVGGLVEEHQLGRAGHQQRQGSGDGAGRRTVLRPRRRCTSPSAGRCAASTASSVDLAVPLPLVVAVRSGSHPEMSSSPATSVPLDSGVNGRRRLNGCARDRPHTCVPNSFLHMCARGQSPPRRQVDVLCDQRPIDPRRGPAGISQRPERGCAAFCTKTNQFIGDPDGVAAFHRAVLVARPA